MDTNINLLVIWNSVEKTKERNLKMFIEDFLLLHDSHNYQLTLVYSETELNNVLIENNFTYIIVLCELIWENNTYTDFYGIELVQQQIRVKYNNRKPINLPILFVSFCNREQIIKKDQTKEIINTYGLANHFIQLPNASETDIVNFWKLKPASELEMIDTLHFCAYDRMIASIRHGIGTIPLEQLKLKILNIISKIDYKLKLNEIKYTFTNCNSTENFKLLCDKLEELISVSSISSRPIVERGEFKVLLVDDETTNNLKALIDEAAPGILINHYNTTAGALQTLKDDFLNDYQVVISDYRIYDNPESVTMQTMLYPQGYTFIEQSAKLGHLYKYISFSGLPRAFRIAVAERLNIRIETVDKELMTSTKEGRKAFIDKIIDLADENLNNLSGIASDDYYFKTLYKRILIEKLPIEEEVTDEAIKLISFLNKCLDPNKKNEIILNPKNNFANYWNEVKTNFFLQSETQIAMSDDEYYVDEIKKLVKAVKSNYKKFELANEKVNFSDFKEFVIQTIEDNSKLTKENNIYFSLDDFSRNIFSNTIISNRRDDNITLAKHIYKEIKSQNNSYDHLLVKFKNSTIRYKDPYSPDAIEKFIGKLIARRFAIYCYYWLSVNYKIDNIDDVTGLTQAVNRMLIKGYIGKKGLTDRGICSQGLFLSVRKPHKDIKELHQIALTNEELNFYRKNYPDLYEKWNK